MAFEIEQNILKKYTEEDGVTEVTVPDGVTEIGESAFKDCKHLTSIHLPDSVTSIGEAAFFSCKHLTHIHISNRVTEIKRRAFAGCEKLMNIDIPDGVTEISKFAFDFCKNLISIHLPDSVAKIGDNAFFHCECLTSIHLPENMTEIGAGAFSGCANLTTICLPEKITYIRKLAFSGCGKLKEIFIPVPVSGNGETVKMSLIPENFSTTIPLMSGKLNMLNYTPLMEQIQMLRTRNFSIKMDLNTKYLLLCRFLILCPELPELVAYMKNNFEEIFAFAIQHNLIEAVLILISWNFLNQQNIDGFIQLAIDNTQKTGDPTIQVTLTEYKYKHIEFTSIEDKFKL